MARERTIVGIDVGTTKTCTLIGEVSGTGGLHVIGVGVAPSRGLRKGVVVNIEETVESIAASVEKAERVSGYKILSAYLGIAGAHIASLNNRGVVAISHPDRIIDERDVDRAIEAARVINVPSNREILHAIPRHYIVDGQEGVRNPVGMLGYRLDVEAHIVTGAVTAIQNLSKCLHRLGVDVDALVLEPLASSEATLTEEEREMGVVLVDIGGGTTGLAVFIEGSVWHTSVLSVGGNHLTNDIAVRLRTPFAEAEELKTACGHALPYEVEATETVEVTTFGRDQIDEVPRVDICEVIEARLQEMVQLIEGEIKRSGYDGLLPAGVVLTGGTAQLSGIAEFSSELLQLPVRVGQPHGIYGLVDTICNPSYATSVGLLLYGAEQGDHILEARRNDIRRSVRVDRRSQEGLDVSGRLIGWLRAFLP